MKCPVALWWSFPSIHPAQLHCGAAAVAPSVMEALLEFPVCSSSGRTVLTVELMFQRDVYGPQRETDEKVLMGLSSLRLIPPSY